MVSLLGKEYSWLLNNTNLNCTGPLTGGFQPVSKYYSTTQSTVGWNPGWENADTEQPVLTESWIRRVNYKLHSTFFTSGRIIAPNPGTGQGSTA